MGKLIKKKYWDLLYKKEKSEFKRPFLLKILKYFVLKFFNKRILEYMQTDYSDYFLWDVIYNNFLPKIKDAKILEVGCVPGNNLIKFHKKFGFDPYGVDYSEIGVEKNKENFISNNLNPNNIICIDFFSNSFKNQYKKFFDIVFSGGFIEHFTNVKKVIQDHIDLLKINGYLIIIIPNIRGFNYFLFKFFNKQIIEYHNLKIMQKKEFINLFDKNQLKTLYCNFFGIFNLRLFFTEKSRLKKNILRVFKIYLKPFLDIIFRIVFSDKGFDTFLFSPYLIFIGIKKM